MDVDSLSPRVGFVRPTFFFFLNHYFHISSVSPVFPTFLSEKGKEDVLLQWDWEQEVASRSGVCNPWFCVLQLWPHPLQMSESLELGFVCVHTFTVVCEYVWVESVLQNVHLSWMLVHHHLVYFPSVSVFSVFTAGLSSVNPAGIMSAADTFFFWHRMGGCASHLHRNGIPWLDAGLFHCYFSSV